MQNYLKILFAFIVLSGCSGFASDASAQDSAARETMDAAINQSNGDYSEIDMPYLWSLGMQQKAWNKPMEHLGEGQSKPGYSRYFWTPDLVLPLRIREGMHTLINFPSWEYIENVYIGNETAFGVQNAAPNAIMVFASNPDMIGMDTNMMVFGRSGNRYVFYLRSETFNADRITNAVVDIIVSDAKFTPDDSGKTPYSEGLSEPGNTGMSSFGGKAGNGRAKGKGNKTKSFVSGETWLEDLEMDPEKLKFDIDVFIPNPEDMEIAPERVWRDEIFTYIDFGPKALSMIQRPVVSLLVQNTESPIGFRTRGPNGRLMVVEGIGDLVLRNGKRFMCLKIRKDPTYGLDNAEYADPSVYKNMPSVSQTGVGMASSIPQANVMQMHPSASNGMMMSVNGAAGPQTYGSSSRQTAQAAAVFADRYRKRTSETIAIELGTDAEISVLEKQWDNIYRKNKDLIGNFEPYYSVDTVAEGETKDVFRLRIGPVSSLQEGDKICSQLGRRGITCIVVRTQ